MKKCAEVIVTYNRKVLLEENINALLNQTYKNHDIYIIDNASTDGTKEVVEKYLNKNENIKYFNTGSNLGGAGGFTYGIKQVMTEKTNYDYVWIMDDDSIPENQALASLVNKAEQLNDEFSYLASLVYWTDGKIFPMNLPTLDNKDNTNLRLDLTSKYKIVSILTSSFVGCFINAKYIKKIGLPIKEFFIYGDDVEYTYRLLRENNAYLDLDSVIIHKSPSNSGCDIATASDDRISRYYYQSRNLVYIARKYKLKMKRFKEIIRKTGKIILKSPSKKIKRLWCLYKGTIAGLFFNPPIEYIDDSKE